MGTCFARSSACDFTSLKDYDALNKVESNNYGLEYYVSMENLAVTFSEELEEETETQGGGSEVSKSGHPNPIAKDQVEPKSKAVVGTTASDLEGCLEVPSGLASSGGFDDNLIIEFASPILHSPEV